MKSKKVSIALILLFVLTLGGTAIANVFLDAIWLDYASSAALVITLILGLIFLRIMAKNQSKLESSLQDLSHAGEEGSSRLNFWSKAQQHLQKVKERIENAESAIQLVGEENNKLAEIAESQDPLIQSIRDLDLRLAEYSHEARRRSWSNEGIARLSDILRIEHGLDELADEILLFLVKYIEANQAGFYMLNGDTDGEEPYLEMIGCYAYNRKKHLHQKIYQGDGLLGQCMMEKDLILLTEIPQEYVSITSGLGDAPPRNIIILPLIINDNFQGAIEIASFQVHPEYHIEFLQMAAESIASTLSSTKVNQRTKKLLEETQTMANELQSNEEEMRQNMEELSATQEEMSRKQSELSGIVRAMDSTMASAEFSSDGYLIKSNPIMEKVLKLEEDQLKGTRIEYFLSDKMKPEDVWEQLRSHQIVRGEYWLKGFKNICLHASLTPISNSNNELIKILVLAQDVTERKKQEVELERLSLVADNTDNSVIITDDRGCIEFVNIGFTKMSGYELSEIKGRKPGSFLQGPDTNKETARRISGALKRNEPIYEEILNYSKSGETYWISLAINPVFDEEGKVKNYISVQANITQTKQRALDYTYKLQAIERSNAVIEFDMTGKILEANENFLKIVKYDRDEVIGKHHSIFLTEEDKTSDEYVEFWDRLRQGEFITQEFRRLDKNGRMIWMKGVYSPIIDINGNPSKVAKFATDITVEKRLTELSKKQEMEIKSQMSAVGKFVAFLEFDLRANVVNANDFFCSISGYPMQKLFGKKYKKLFPESLENSPQVTMIWENVIKGQEFTGEFTMSDAEGKPMYLYGTYYPMANENREVERVVMFAQFITREKEKQNDLGGIVEALRKAAPVVELNLDGTFKKANQIFFDLFGFKRLELKKKNFFDILTEKDAKKISFSKWEEDYREILLSFQTVEGIEIQCRTTFSTVRNLEGDVIKLVVILFRNELQLSDKG